MDIYELLSQLFHLRQRNGRVVDKGPAFARRSQFPAENAFVVVVDVVLDKEILQMIAA